MHIEKLKKNDRKKINALLTDIIAKHEANWSTFIWSWFLYNISSAPEKGSILNVWHAYQISIIIGLSFESSEYNHIHGLFKKTKKKHCI